MIQPDLLCDCAFVFLPILFILVGLYIIVELNLKMTNAGLPWWCNG